MKQKPQLFANLLRTGLFLAAAIYFFTHFDFTSLNLPGLNSTPQPTPSSPVQANSNTETERVTPPNPSQPQAERAAKPQEQDASNFYTYTDDQGIIHMANDLNKVPQKYRSGMKVTSGGKPRATSTPVLITRNQVLVPVIVSFRGFAVEARLLFDTGATVTTINERLAAALGVEASDVRPGKATVADGRSVRGYSFTADSLTVGAKARSTVQISILPGSGNEGYDGLLGMDFLKNFRYHVDFERSVIDWDS
jgi:predicted aspartyl protease